MKKLLNKSNKKNSMVLVRKRTMPTELPPLVLEVIVAWSAQRMPTAVNFGYQDR
jgi:hypothetical protein